MVVEKLAESAAVEVEALVGQVIAFPAPVREQVQIRGPRPAAHAEEAISQIVATTS